jgi:hypothetical protein
MFQSRSGGWNQVFAENREFLSEAKPVTAVSVVCCVKSSVGSDGLTKAVGASTGSVGSVLGEL